MPSPVSGSSGVSLPSVASESPNVRTTTPAPTVAAPPANRARVPADVGEFDVTASAPRSPPRVIAIAKPAPSATEAERFAYWSAVVRVNGGQVNPHGQATVLGLRGMRADGSLHTTSVTRDYDDLFIVLKPDGSVVELAGSTHPGNEEGPGVPALGVGLMRPGVYSVKPLGQRFGGPAFSISTDSQASVPGYRDTNRDGIFSAEEKSASTGRGDRMTSVLFHQNSAYSIGCQTFAPTQWLRFVDAIGGASHSFSYVLVDAGT